MRRPPEKKDLARAELAGIFVSAAHIVFENGSVAFELCSERAGFCRYVYSLIFKIYGRRADVRTEKSARFRNHRRYCLRYADAADVLSDTKTLARGRLGWYSPVFGDIYERPENVRRAFLRGVFLACGSVANPEKNYHLELDAPSSVVPEVCAELLEGFGIVPGQTARKHHTVLYLKEAQAISNFLALIGANKAMLGFEDVRILKQMRGDVNRQVNCETANMNKTAAAADEQIEAIEKLKKTGAYAQLAPELRAAAELRAAHPTLSTGALCAAAEPPVSRSTLFRRLKKIVALSRQVEE